ncbi:MAG: 2-oxoacid:acceptor oxidoreductase family protein [Candidatus Korarchaeota archaeon]|nr:2-oxoacid:acceptor oxidoreductase family protein [Candidatus Korarchaeota archaeon]
MVEIRWHGRGGQGVVLASRLLAKAAFYEGKWSQAFPFFGAERRGAPVMAFTRISSRPIRLRSQIYHPDVLVLVDPMFLGSSDVFEGLKAGATVVANTPRDPEELSVPEEVGRVATVDATGLALRLGLKVAGLPVPNTAMVGAVAKATGLAEIGSVESAIRDTLSGRGVEVNLSAAREGFDTVKVWEPGT